MAYNGRTKKMIPFQIIFLFILPEFNKYIVYFDHIHSYQVFLEDTNKLANIFGRKQKEEAKFCLKSRSWLITGLHLESRSLGLESGTAYTSMSVPIDDNGENSQQQPRSQTPEYLMGTGDRLEQ